MAARKKSKKKYGKKASEKVAAAMREMKRGELYSGRSGKKVTSRKQAVAIGLSEARAEGGKVPSEPKKAAKKKSMGRSSSKKTTSSRGASSKKTTKKTTSSRGASSKKRAKKPGRRAGG